MEALIVSRLVTHAAWLGWGTSGQRNACRCYAMLCQIKWTDAHQYVL